MGPPGLFPKPGRGRLRPPAASRCSAPASLRAPCISEERSAKLEVRRMRTEQAARSLVRQDRREARSPRSSRAQPEQLPEPSHGELASTRSGQTRHARRAECRVAKQIGTESIGIDVSKARLDVCALSQRESWQVANTSVGIAALVDQV